MPGPAGDDNNVAELVVQLVSCDTSLTEVGGQACNVERGDSRSLGTPRTHRLVQMQVFSLLSEYGYAVQDDGAHDDARGREPCAQRQGRPRRGRSPRRVPSPPTPPVSTAERH